MQHSPYLMDVRPIHVWEVVHRQPCYFLVIPAELQSRLLGVDFKAIRRNRFFQNWPDGGVAASHSIWELCEADWKLPSVGRECQIIGVTRVVTAVSLCYFAQSAIKSEAHK